MIKKIKNSPMIVFLAGVALISYASVIFITLTYGQVTVDSDISLVYRFYRSVVDNKSIYPESWNAVNGEVYAFTRLPVNVLLQFLMSNKLLPILLSNVILFTVSNLGFIWLARKHFGNNSWLFCIPAYSLFLCSKNARTMIFLHGAYGPMIIIFTFGFGLFWMSMLKENHWIRATVIHSLMLFLMILGGKRHLAEYLLPTIITVVLYLLFINKSKEVRKRISAKSALALLIPSVLGFALYKYVCSTHNMNFGGNSNPNAGIGIGVLFDNFLASMGRLYSLFGYNPDKKLVFNILAVTICTLVCIVVPVLQAIEFKKLNDKEKTYFLFAVVHNLELLAAIVLFDMNQPRYMLSTAFIWIIVSSNYCFKKLSGISKSQIRAVVVGLFVLVSAVFCRDLLKLSVNWQDKVAEKKSISQQLVDHGITKGYASFWLGYPNEVYSNGKLTFGGVDVADASLIKQYSNCDNSCYEYQKGKCCVLLSQKECEFLVGTLGADYINKLIGEPIDTFEITGQYLNELYETDKITVYIFEDDVCDRLTDGLRDGVLNPREMVYNQLGTRTDDAIYLNQGGIIHGPYKKIAPGDYTVTYKGDNLETCEAYVMSEQAQNCIEYSEVSRTDDEIVLELSVSNYVEDVQFYLINNDEDEVAFNEIVIENR